MTVSTDKRVEWGAGLELPELAAWMRGKYPQRRLRVECVQLLDLFGQFNPTLRIINLRTGHSVLADLDTYHRAGGQDFLLPDAVFFVLHPRQVEPLEGEQEDLGLQEPELQMGLFQA